MLQGQACQVCFGHSGAIIRNLDQLSAVFFQLYLGRQGFSPHLSIYKANMRSWPFRMKRDTSIFLAPASKAFSINSFTAVARLTTTCPLDILWTTFSETGLIRCDISTHQLSASKP